MNEPYVYMNIPDPDRYICVTIISQLIYLCAHSLHSSRHKLTLSLGSSTVFDLFGCRIFKIVHLQNLHPLSIHSSRTW